MLLGFGGITATRSFRRGEGGKLSKGPHGRRLLGAEAGNSELFGCCAPSLVSSTGWKARLPQRVAPAVVLAWSLGYKNPLGFPAIASAGFCQHLVTIS